MNMLVLIKQTFDTEDSIVIDQGTISEDGMNYVMNPYDEYAIEEAIRIKEQTGGSVTAVTIGPSRAEAVLRTAFAMGADKAIHVEDEAAFGDEYTISAVLSAIAKRDSYQLILGGYMAVDDGSAQIGPRVAELLDIPHVSTITGLKIEGQKAVVQKDSAGDIEVIEVSLPLLVTAQQGLNEPRYPSLPGIMKAKKQPIEVLTLSDLGLNRANIESKTAIVNQYLPPKKTAGKIFTGDFKMQVTELASLLHEKENII